MVLGVFGYIGTGKSTALDYLKTNHNFYIIDADKKSKIVLGYEEVREFIKNKIPESFDFENNIVDRSKLRSIIFTKKSLNLALGKIMWPHISRLIRDDILTCNKDKIAVEAALLPLLKLPIDKYIYLINKNYGSHINRIDERDQRDNKEIRKILKIQETMHKESNIDYIIDNSSNKEELFRKLDKVIENIYSKKMQTF
ncbi:dephospho-CoA kinase [Spiroplasma sabaudiense Ar-1343]|uniref:Dephospho-CoA kinase n=1 Tax=Spiroplasma sabaudiense Ar-1343 TaxID=1276257 RepID=W6A9P4_9MOLU|nr:dephospho-CoA kinase [Spiroplasma sabaudiense]AHI53888.1 dephospho-CoA kinase [Spiroplasma sabaudiense Ar-1343]